MVASRFHYIAIAAVLVSVACRDSSTTTLSDNDPCVLCSILPTRNTTLSKPGLTFHKANTTSNSLLYDTMPLVVAHSENPEAEDIQRRLDVNTNIVLGLESLRTSVYWPGGNSGPTIGVGVDLGNTGRENIITIFKGLVTQDVLASMLTADGLRGQEASAWVQAHDLQISETIAYTAFMRTCKIYWRYTETKFGQSVHALDPTVKGVLLSIVINYGPASSEMQPLVVPVQERDMAKLAHVVSTMGSGTSDSILQKALVRRRQIEHDVILLASCRNLNGKVDVD